MIKLSTGHDSTLGNYRDLSKLMFGENSPQVRFLDSKIASNPNGRDEEVVAEETQMMYLLFELTGRDETVPQMSELL